MAPPARNIVACYLYREKGTKLWTAESKDFPICKVTCMEPEDTLKRIQSLVLRELADQLDRGDIPLSDRLEVLVNVQIVSQDEARRLMGVQLDPYDSLGDP